jgi:hypothetical protein
VWGLHPPEVRDGLAGRSRRDENTDMVEAQHQHVARRRDHCRVDPVLTARLGHLRRVRSHRGQRLFHPPRISSPQQGPYGVWRPTDMRPSRRPRRPATPWKPSSRTRPRLSRRGLPPLLVSRWHWSRPRVRGDSAGRRRPSAGRRLGPQPSVTAISTLSKQHKQSASFTQIMPSPCTGEPGGRSASPSAPI